ncbi:hypothetical protein [Cohnella sp. AR92]|uniref:hypothetical protein n=1 Tax=Cohnella sp. AR92 TaxID=648716 RepID=UPI000F8D8B75|nr:hypothetical protein [Cohnella sp. AR92]RUS44258.1 hypothetical protein ELR57_23410 [Cohnella sp. AR92]
MIALIRYFSAYYLRSYRHLLPVCAYVGIIVWVYSVVPNPVMDSYAFTSLLLFFVSAWIGYGFVDLEHEAQRLVTYSRAGSMARYCGAQYLFMMMIAAAFSLLATVYPILFDKFDRTPTLEEALVAAGAHLVLASLGIACAMWFSEKMVASRMTAILGLLLTLAISAGAMGIAEQLPSGAKGILWLLPPVSRVTDVFINYEDSSSIWIVFVLLLPALYSGVLLWGYIRVAKAKMY